ncbi:MAG: hypothetical protein ACYC6M_05010 [Terriglobales bacterium]
MAKRRKKRHSLRGTSVEHIGSAKAIARSLRHDLQDARALLKAGNCDGAFLAITNAASSEGALSQARYSVSATLGAKRRASSKIVHRIEDRFIKSCLVRG